jgi:hypothetical protein
MAVRRERAEILGHTSEGTRKYVGNALRLADAYRHVEAGCRLVGAGAACGGCRRETAVFAGECGTGTEYTGSTSGGRPAGADDASVHSSSRAHGGGLDRVTSGPNHAKKPSNHRASQMRTRLGA